MNIWALRNIRALRSIRALTNIRALKNIRALRNIRTLRYIRVLRNIRALRNKRALMNVRVLRNIRALRNKRARMKILNFVDAQFPDCALLSIQMCYLMEAHPLRVTVQFVTYLMPKTSKGCQAQKLKKMVCELRSALNVMDN